MFDLATWLVFLVTAAMVMAAGQLLRRRGQFAAADRRIAQDWDPASAPPVHPLAEAFRQALAALPLQFGLGAKAWMRICGGPEGMSATRARGSWPCVTAWWSPRSC